MGYSARPLEDTVLHLRSYYPICLTSAGRKDFLDQACVRVPHKSLGREAPETKRVRPLFPSGDGVSQVLNQSKVLFTALFSFLISGRSSCNAMRL